MHIVYVTNSIDYIGGIETVLFHKCNYFVSLDHDVTIVISDSNGINKYASRLDKRVNIVDTGAKLFEYNGRSGIINKIKSFCKTGVLFVKLRKTLKSIKPDIVISVGKSEKFIIPFLSIGAKWVSIREYHFDKYYRQQYAHYNDQGKLSSIVHAWLGYAIEHYFPMPSYDATVILTRQDHVENWKSSSKVKVIPNPVKLTDLALPVQRNKKVFSVSRITRVKQVHHLVLAWKEVHKYAPDWVLEIWGPSDADYEQEIKLIIRENDLNDVITLNGPTSDPMSIMALASIFAYASAYEGFGVVLVEAMSCGLPCVSYTCPCGPKDIITDGVDGLWVENGNVEDMAAKLLLLIRDENRRKAMGQAALEKAKQYSIESIGQKWLDLFNELLTKKRA